MSTTDVNDTGELIGYQIQDLIENAITNQPRSLQRMIGPSEIGNPCTHCLAARLASWTKTETRVPWLPYIGTAVHEALQGIFDTLQQSRKPDDLEFWTERKVTVGTLAGKPITGSADLFIPNVRGACTPGINIDWKIVGKTTLDTVRRTHYPGQQYEIQAHLYGLGWENAGQKVSHVCVFFMPRNGMSLSGGYWWSAPYDPQIAKDALGRLASLYTSMTAITTALGAEGRDTWIASLDRNPDCWDCRKYPDWVNYTTPKIEQTTIDDII
ncbi:hypothetical protein [Actinotignum urinale]|uniref:hypothetical protein n=1 Tax=Actinotignum urinale TaxID=190146 RepID=UPI0003B6F835|nr:hypothetical protein [Actinotignum urinale]MDY5159550.1 hypothetical protein [Actinotignum urinale]